MAHYQGRSDKGCKGVFHDWKMYKDINCTVINLIPKNKNSNTVKDTDQLSVVLSYTSWSPRCWHQGSKRLY